MGVFDKIKNGIDNLAGAAEKKEQQRQAEQQKKIEAEADKELKAKQDKEAADIAKAKRITAETTIPVVRVDQHALAGDRRKEPGPIERFARDDDRTRIKAAVQTWPKTIDHTHMEREVTRMEPVPAGSGLQPEPTPGGLGRTFRNRGQSLAEQIERQEKIRHASMSPEERAADLAEKESQRRDHERELAAQLDRGRERTIND